MADIDQERADLHALIREAHEAIKDLNGTLRLVDERIAIADKASTDLLAVITDIDEVTKATMSRDIGKMLEDVAKENVDAYSAAWQNAIEKAEQVIFKRFDLLFESITGGVKGVPKFGSIADDIIADKRRGS